MRPAVSVAAPGDWLPIGADTVRLCDHVKTPSKTRPQQSGGCERRAVEVHMVCGKAYCWQHGANPPPLYAKSAHRCEQESSVA